MIKTMVSQAVLLQAMEVHSGAEIQLQPVDSVLEQVDVPKGGCDPVVKPVMKQALGRTCEPMERRTMLKQLTKNCIGKNLYTEEIKGDISLLLVLLPQMTTTAWLSTKPVDVLVWYKADKTKGEIVHIEFYGVGDQTLRRQEWCQIEQRLSKADWGHQTCENLLLGYQY
ncbi:hypothetical protein BTVI_66566 [Pitangus sulphuratus]|nr:hypothetical protein BTVI_66566 [Pitangus sulphuratus]